MFSSPWKDHRCHQWMDPHYEYKIVVEGIHLWSVNEHRRKFPSRVARQPPPIKSHLFPAGIINTECNYSPWRKQGDRDKPPANYWSHALWSSETEQHFPVPWQPGTDPTTLPWGEPPALPLLIKKRVALYQNTLPQPSTCIFNIYSNIQYQYSMGMSPWNWSNQMSHP